MKAPHICIVNTIAVGIAQCLGKILGLHEGDYEYTDFWDIKTEFVLHGRHIKSPLQSPAG
jgi:hypothetical protein